MILWIICSQFLLYFLVQELEADISSARCFSLIGLSDHCILKLFLGEVSGFLGSLCSHSVRVVDHPLVSILFLQWRECIKSCTILEKGLNSATYRCTHYKFLLAKEVFCLWICTSICLCLEKAPFANKQKKNHKSTVWGSGPLSESIPAVKFFHSFWSKMFDFVASPFF